MGKFPDLFSLFHDEGSICSIYNQEESWFPTPLIDCHSLMPTWLPTESEAPSINPRCARFFFAFPRRFAFSLALRFSWRFFFPGGSRYLAIPVSWRFPCPDDSQHVLAGRALVVLQLQLQLKVGSWLLLVPPRSLVSLFSRNVRKFRTASKIESLFNGSCFYLGRQRKRSNGKSYTEKLELHREATKGQSRKIALRVGGGSTPPPCGTHNQPLSGG